MKSQAEMKITKLVKQLQAYNSEVVQQNKKIEFMGKYLPYLIFI